MTGPKAPKDPTAKGSSFYVCRQKGVAGNPTPDGRGVQFIYLDGGRLITFAKMIGNVEDEKMLDKLVGRFVEVCSFTRQEAVQQGLLKVYGDFPENSHFKIPPHIKGKVSWGTIRKIGGQKPRLAGYIIESVFYPVFLDKDHLFYPSTKKHT